MHQHHISQIQSNTIALTAHYSFETEKALSFLRTKAVPEGFDILVNEEGKPLDVSIMTEDFIEKIKKYANEAKNTKDMKKVGVELYDEQANDGQGEIINNQTGYNLSKINTYKVALVLPNALLETK